MANIGTSVVTTFGIEKVEIKLPSAPAGTWSRIPSILQASYKGSVSEVEVYGDDTYQDTWYHSAKGQIQVKASKSAMRVFEMLTGEDATVSATSYEQIQIMTDEQLTPPNVAVRCTIKARADDGSVGKVQAIFYKCRVRTTFESVPDGAHAKAGEVTLTFDVLRSEKDENNTNSADTLPTGKAAFGRLVMPKAAA